MNVSQEFADVRRTLTTYARLQGLPAEIVAPLPNNIGVGLWVMRREGETIFWWQGVYRIGTKVEFLYHPERMREIRFGWDGTLLEGGPAL